jgi:hypothetical protein
MRLLLLAALLGAAGCSATEVGIEFNASALGLLLPQVTLVRLNVDGDEHYSVDIPRHPLMTVERLVYRAAKSSGTLTFTISTLDADGMVLGCGSETAMLHAGAYTQVEILLGPGPCSTGEDGGVPDGGGTLPPSSCDHPQPAWVYCDGFDGPGLDPGWSPQLSLGHVDIDSSTSYRGAGSAHFTYDVAASFEDMGSDYEVARIGRSINKMGPLYIRVFIRLPAHTTTVTSKTVWLRYIHDSGDETGMAMEWLDGNTLNAVANGGNTYDQAGGAVSPTAWSCVEWQIPTRMGDTHVWIDDVEVPELAGSNLSFGFQLGFLGLGGDPNVAAFQSAELWMDDLVVSTARVGCTN